MPAHRLGAGMLAVLGACAAPCRAWDVETFKVTGVDGYATLRYVDDQQTAGGGGGGTSKLGQSGWRNEIFVMSHSYVYHPNFLTLDIGGGPVLHWDRFVADGSDTRDSGALYNLTARANFLRDKPYTGSLFFEHLNPTVSIAPGQVLTQENVRYGADFSLLAPATSVPMQVSVTHAHNQGRGTDRQVDDQIDQFNLVATKAYGATGSTQVQVQTSQQASASGSLGLPVQKSTAENQAVHVDTRLQLGSERQYDLTNLISVDRQRYAIDAGALPDLSDRRFLLDLRGRHSEQLHSYASYSFDHSHQGDLDSVTNAGTAGVNYWPDKQWESALAVRGEDTRTYQFTLQDQGLDGSLRYERPLGDGILQLRYAARYDRRNQQAFAPQTGVIGERQTLVGTAYVTLTHTHVTAGSVVVSNATRSQTYVDGIDYLLTVVGFETRIQRLVGGRILDGDTVLVDYSYDVGGTYAYDQLDQTLSADWSLSRYLDAYVRHYSSSPRLTSGSPTFPLNDVQSTLWGLRADLPFKLGIPVTLGGSLEWEDRRETVAPYRRTAADAYLQTDEPFLDLAFVRAATHRTRIDYALAAAQNVNLVGYDLRAWTREWFGMDLAFAASFERDDGGILPRQRQESSINLQWHERKFTLTASLARTRESQGSFERSRTLFQFLARRDF